MYLFIFDMPKQHIKYIMYLFIFDMPKQHVFRYSQDIQRSRKFGIHADTTKACLDQVCFEFKLYTNILKFD